MASRLAALKIALDKEIPQLRPTQSAVARAKCRLTEQRRKQDIEHEEALISHFSPKLPEPPCSAPASARGRGDGTVKTILGNVLPARTWLKSMLGSPKLRQHVASQHFDKLDRSRSEFIGWPEVQALSLELYSSFGMPAPPDVWLREAFNNCRGDHGRASPETLSKAEFASFFEVYLRSAHARINMQEEERKGVDESYAFFSGSMSARSTCASDSNVDLHALLALTESTASLPSSGASLESSAASSEVGDAEGPEEIGDTPLRRTPPADGEEEVCCEDERVLWGGVGGTIAAMCIFLL